MAVVLCRASYANETTPAYIDRVSLPYQYAMSTLEKKNVDIVPRYCCALIAPGSAPDVYELMMGRQVLPGVDMMRAEVLMERDAITT